MTQNNSTPQWKSLVGCLGRRVLTISFLLLVVPLLIHSVMLYREAVHKSIIDNLNNLALLARSEANYVSQLIRQNLADIKTVDLLGGYATKDFSQDTHANFSEIAVSESLSSFFLAEKSADGTWAILAAANPERLNQNEVDPVEYDKILSLKTSVYLFKNSILQKKELRIGFAISPNRILVSGTPLDGISSALIRTPLIKSQPIAAFMNQNDELYFSTAINLDLTQTRLFAPEELIDVSSQPLENFKLFPNDQFVGVKFPLAGNSFYLVIALTKAQFLDISSQAGFNHLLQLTILFVLIGGSGVVFLTSRVARPLKQLFFCLDKVGEGDLKVRFQNDPVGFELNILGQKFNEMLTNLENNIQEAKKQRMAKELLKQEFGIGQDIQKSILKSSLKEAEDFNFATAFTPAMEVSGDFYDVYKLNDDKVLISVADTAGKGISACLFSLGARSTLRALAKSGLGIEDILKETNKLFMDDSEYTGSFITVFVGLLDLKTGTLTYASCGHPPAILVTDTSVQVLKAGGMALGVDPTLRAEISTLSLKKGDKVFIYTDGVIEATNTQNQMYTQERLVKFLDSQKAHTGNVIVHDLQKDVETFTDQAELHDDITIVCIEKKTRAL